MKKLYISIGAALLVLAMAGAASAWAGHGWSSNSLDPMGHAWITIQAPSQAETAHAAPNIAYLDSNGLMAVQNPWPLTSEGVSVKAAPAGKFVCFDSASRSCAVSD